MARQLLPRQIKARMLTTSFRLLRENEACVSRYRHLARALGGVKVYGEDTRITLAQILDSNGLKDALWALRAVAPEQAAERDSFSRLLACDYAEHVEHAWQAVFPGDSRLADVRAVVRRYAQGKATEDELSDARSAADGAWGFAAAARASANAAYAAAAAANATAYAAYNAAYAAYSAAADAAYAAGSARDEREWQEARLREALAGEGER